MQYFASIFLWIFEFNIGCQVVRYPILDRVYVSLVKLRLMVEAGYAFCMFVSRMKSVAAKGARHHADEWGGGQKAG
jgi:uncharacterized membrane-anchored protein